MTLLNRVRDKLGEKAITLPRFIRFLLVGGVNTLFGYGVFASCFFLGISVAFSLAISFALGTIFNFVTYSKGVFSDARHGFLGRFGLLSCALYLVNLGLLNLVVWCGLLPIVAQAMLVLPMAALTFCLNRLIVFPGTPRP